VTDLHIEGPVPQQTCIFPQLRELDLDGGSMTGTIPEFLTTCFPVINEIDLSYNQVRVEPSTLVEFLIWLPVKMLAACYSVIIDGVLFYMCIPTCQA